MQNIREKVLEAKKFLADRTDGIKSPCFWYFKKYLT